jgi:aspartate aminotransferase-like enzyme
MEELAAKYVHHAYSNTFVLTRSVMQNYEAKKPSYFATPSPQLVHALDTALKQILSRPLEQRFADHKAASQKIKKAVSDFGLKQLASKPENQANGMTAIYLPEGITPPDVLPRVSYLLVDCTRRLRPSTSESGTWASA